MKLLKLKKTKTLTLKSHKRQKKKKEWRHIKEDDRRRQAGGANKDKHSKRLKLSETNQERGRHEDTITCSRPLNGSSGLQAGPAIFSLICLPYDLKCFKFIIHLLRDITQSKQNE